jgi:hypothetical protein
VAEQVKRVLTKFCCVNKLIPTLSGLFTMDYGLHALYLHTMSRNVTIQSHIVNETFQTNLYIIKHTIIFGDIIKGAIYSNL